MDLQRSGRSLNAFAKGRGLCAQRLRWWRGRLALGEVGAGLVAPPVRLVELVLPAAAVVAPMAALWVQVHCPTGHTIELLDLDGLGAKVELTAGGRTHTAWSSASAGVFAGRDPRIHLGLGDAARIEHIRVTWPSGQVTEAELDLEPRRRLILTEPD